MLDLGGKKLFFFFFGGAVGWGLKTSTLSKNILGKI